ncbi:MAG: esterase family protein [Bacteroidales bacterium]|nr:esterase family protein [Bacteroidales bacterium]MCF8404117.1 esterase family protein [Bacteroidales bacterium]
MTSILRLTLTFLISLAFLSGWTGCADDFPDKEEVGLLLLENEALQSEVLKRPVNYAVVLPEGYYNTTDSYPVVYLLHGFGDNCKAWYNAGSIRYFSERMGADIVPMIFVMMDAYTTYYVDKYNGRFPYMEMVTTELVPEIDSIYRTEKSSIKRAVMGYSMGGYGALILPILNPEVFGISVPLSMSFRTDEQYISESADGWDYQWGSVFGGAGLQGEDRLTDYYKEHNPFYLFKEADLSAYREIRFMIHCGDDEESLHIPSGELHNLMRKNEINHEFRVADGGHSWDYWHSTMSESLKFISCGFEEISYPENPEPAGTGIAITTDQYYQDSLPGSSLQIGIFLPSEYDSSNHSYPSIYFLHDTGESERTENTSGFLSLLNGRMENGSIPKSIVIEIPVNNFDFTAGSMELILDYINQNFSVADNKNARILMANGEGGKIAANLLPDFAEKFNAGFLFNGNLSPETIVAEGVYYYLDVTDKAVAYEENFNLFLNLRESENDYEYRVRHGKENYQSFLNGLDASIRYIYKHLKT